MCTSFFFFVLTLALLCLNVRLATNFAFKQEMFLLSHIANYACIALSTDLGFVYRNVHAESNVFDALKLILSLFRDRSRPVVATHAWLEVYCIQFFDFAVRIC